MRYLRSSRRPDRSVAGPSVRIVYILTSLGMGGAELQALNIAERMFQRGHAVTVITLRPLLSEQWPTTLPVHHLNMHRSSFSFVVGLARARRILRAFCPDIIHSHNFHANIFARLLKPLISPAAVVSTIHNVYEGGRLRMAAYRLTDPFADRTTAVSQAAAERFIRLKAVPAQKCIPLANAIDILDFKPNPDRRAATRACMGVTSEFIWLAAGRQVPAKDFPNLFAAFAKVSEAAPATQLWAAGKASDGHSEAGRREVVLVAMSKETREQIRFLGLRRDMAALLDAADAFVLASAWEGMPLVLAEAMAMQKPVVATNVGGVRELLGEIGAIVPPKNSAALADAMLNVMNQPAEDSHAQTRAARQRIADHFNIVSRADEWEALYQSLMENRARSRQVLPQKALPKR